MVLQLRGEKCVPVACGNSYRDVGFLAMWVDVQRSSYLSKQSKYSRYVATVLLEFVFFWFLVTFENTPKRNQKALSCSATKQKREQKNLGL